MRRHLPWASSPNSSTRPVQAYRTALLTSSETSKTAVSSR